ncbi:hypothetical protein KCU93_g4882, partial [Aureobasidium melanogenum]
MEWDQLTWERFILGMPILYEDLPFLRQFDNAPEVSVYKALDIHQPTPTSITENTREHYHAASNTGPGKTLFSTFNADPGQLITNTHSPIYPFNAAPVEEAPQPPYGYAAHNQGGMVMNSHPSTPSSHAVTAEGAPVTAGKAQEPNDRPKRMKRACKTCTERKTKCNLISGSDPVVCELCNKKGLVCEFEEKKVYTRSSA